MRLNLWVLEGASGPPQFAYLRNKDKKDRTPCAKSNGLKSLSLNQCFNQDYRHLQQWSSKISYQDPLLCSRFLVTKIDV